MSSFINFNNKVSSTETVYSAEVIKIALLESETKNSNKVNKIVEAIKEPITLNEALDFFTDKLRAVKSLSNAITTINEGRVKQFEMDYTSMVKDIKKGYGWIDPDYVAQTWDNSSDSIDFELVRDEIFDRLIAAGLLAHADDNDPEKAGKKIKSAKELYAFENVEVNEARSISKIQKDWSETTTKMSQKVIDWKEAEGDRKTELLDELKALTKRKSELEKELDTKVAGKDRDVQLAISEDHSDNPNDKYEVRPCDEEGTPFAVWEGDVRVECFATEEEAQAFADKQNKEQGLDEASSAVTERRSGQNSDDALILIQQALQGMKNMKAEIKGDTVIISNKAKDEFIYSLNDGGDVQEFIDELEESVANEAFSRMSNDAIGNELYAASQALTTYYDWLKAGNDAGKGKSIDHIISLLKKCKSSIKRFDNKEETIGTEYEAPAMESVVTEGMFSVKDLKEPGLIWWYNKKGDKAQVTKIDKIDNLNFPRAKDAPKDFDISWGMGTLDDWIEKTGEKNPKVGEVYDIDESVVTEAKFVKDFNRDVLDAKTKEEVLELYPNAEFFIGKSDHFFGEFDENLFFKAYYTKGQKEFEIKSVYSEKGSNYVHLYNESVVTENYEVIYSDGVSAMKKFRNEKQALDFMKKEIASNKKLRDIAVYKPGMHSTTQTELVVKFWGDGSYLDNVSKRDEDLAAKKLEEGNAFGAARAEAIAKGEKEFKVDGETFKVEDVDTEDKENAEEFVEESKITLDSLVEMFTEKETVTEDLRSDVKKFIKQNNKELDELADQDQWDMMYQKLYDEFEVEADSTKGKDLLKTFQFVY